MKTRIILLFALSLLVYSCTKNNVEDIDGRYYFTALQNSKQWSATPRVYTYKDTLYIQGGAHEETLTMKIKYTGNGTYTLTGGQAVDVFTIGGDVVISQYKVNSSAVSTVTITSYDQATKEAEGTFDLKLIQSYPTATNPATLNFASGNFKSALTSY